MIVAIFLLGTALIASFTLGAICGVLMAAEWQKEDDNAADDHS